MASYGSDLSTPIYEASMAFGVALSMSMASEAAA